MSAQTKKVGRDLTEGPILPLLVSFAVPMVLASIIQQLYGMVDLMVIGKFVGNVGTVAVGTGGELSDLMTPIATAFAAAGQIYIAQLVGAKNEAKIKSAIGTLLTLMAIVSVAFTVISVVFHRQFLELLNCQADAMEAAAQYLIITAIGMPFIFGYNAICAVLRGMGESKKPLIFVIVAATVNIFLDIILVAVFRLDAAGTAIATVASQIGAFIASFIYLYRRRESMYIRFERSYFQMNQHDLSVIIRLGIPQMIRVMCVQGSMVWVKSNINAYSMVASGTYIVGNKIEKFMNIFIQGVDQAGGAMLGQNIGAKKHDRVKATMRMMITIAMSIGLLVGILFWLIPDVFYGAFSDEIEVIQYGRVFLRIMSVGCVIVGFSGAAKSISSGAGAAMLSLILGVLDGVSRILVCLFFAGILHQGVESYFWGAALCQLIPGIVAYSYYLSGRWKTKKLLSE